MLVAWPETNTTASAEPCRPARPRSRSRWNGRSPAVMRLAETLVPHCSTAAATALAIAGSPLKPR